MLVDIFFTKNDIFINIINSIEKATDGVKFIIFLIDNVISEITSNGEDNTDI